MFSLTDLQLLPASASLLPVKGNAMSGLLGEKGPEGGEGLDLDRDPGWGMNAVRRWGRGGRSAWERNNKPRSE